MRRDKIEYIKLILQANPDLRNHDIRQLYGDRIYRISGYPLVSLDALIDMARKELQCTEERTS